MTVDGEVDAPRVTRSLILAQRPVGLPDALTWAVVERKVPDLAEGDVLVEVTHVSLDPAMRGWLNDVRSYIPPVGLNEVMRSFSAGRVVESRHADFSAGDTVVGLLGVTRHVVVNGSDLTPAPASVAAPPTWLGALGMPGMTAWFGLFDVAHAVAGDTVLVSGAAGAVGSMVGQLAKAQGCRVIGVAGGPEKTRWLTEELGFDAAVDYRQGNLGKAVRAAAPDGVDVFFDNVGGDVLDAALRSLRRGGRIAICGAISTYNETSLPPGPKHYMSLLINRASMAGFVVFDYEDRYPEAVADISRRIGDGSLVAREHVIKGGLEDFGSALLMLFSGENHGKLVLELA